MLKRRKTRGIGKGELFVSYSATGTVEARKGVECTSAMKSRVYMLGQNYVDLLQNVVASVQIRAEQQD